MTFHEQSVHIKICDQGWILEKCAQEITKLAPEISVGLEAKPDAQIQYYVNYSAYRGRVSPIEVGFFTHIEEDEQARKRFFEVAAQMDHCVCMSQRYADELKQSGINQVSVIAPGVDLESYKPRLKIGVVGRTYHTGRKGEALVEEVMDVEGIEWAFTGEGWPGPALNLAAEEIPAFYNSLDYILVPALYEGGPMSVLEGLACGKEIIASDVGWMPDFPHIPFENSNADSLRQVLRSLLAKRYELRSSVNDYSWENWGKKHLELFQKLTQEAQNGPSPSLSTLGKGQTPAKIALVHSRSEKKSKGGPTIRVARTVKELQKLNVDAFEHGSRLEAPDLFHLFNIWPPEGTQTALNQIQEKGLPSILSPIFLNLTNHGLYSTTIPQLYEESRDSELERKLTSVFAQLASQANLPLLEPHEGYHNKVKEVVQRADGLILLSEFERHCLDYLGALDGGFAHLVRNPVNADIFQGADPSLFAQSYGLERYVIQVGRIETRKNQLFTAEACRRLGIPCVFLGHEGDKAYAQLLREVAGPQALFLPRLEQTNPLFASAIAGASAFALPSWAEGAPLAALEAGSTGVPLVLSDRSGEKEYFAEYAHYVNPVDLEGMMEAIQAALAESDNQEKRQARAQYIQQEYCWEKHAQQTAKVYEKVLTSHKAPLSIPPTKQSSGRIFFDVTDWVYAGSKMVGTARMQQCQYQNLPAEFRDRVTPVSWVRGTSSFAEVNPEEISSGKAAEQFFNHQEDACTFVDALNSNHQDRFYSSSGAWVGNDGHFQALINVQRRLGLPVGLVVHDVVSWQLPHLYEERRRTTFQDRLTKLMAELDLALVFSQSTKDALAGMLAERSIVLINTADFDQGEDGLVHLHSPQELVHHRLINQRFLLIVGSIEPRKNHLLLLQVMKQLVDELKDNTPLLVIAGGDHLGSPALNHWLDANPDVAEHVLRLKDLTDEEICWLYQNCYLTLYPSLGEGWGMPIAESFSHGKMCLTSNLSSLPEAAKGFAELLDPYDSRLWADRIKQYLENTELIREAEHNITQNWKPFSWADSITQALEAVIKLPEAEIQELGIPQNRLLDFSSPEDTSILAEALQGGFHSIEPTGVWIRSIQAGILLELPVEKRTSEMTLKLKCWGLVELDEQAPRRQLWVDIHDEFVGSCLVGQDAEIHEFSVPKSALQGHALQIRLKVDRLLSPAEIGLSPDERPLSIFVQALGLYCTQE